MEAESPFGVNRSHSDIILDFLRFARSRRNQCIKSVELEFQDVMESRLVEDTFTSEEVKDMLTGLGAVVRGDVESELIHTSHTHSLLIGQLLQQAERWHLTMTADISSLENKELLEALAQYEQQQFSSTASATGHKATLKPLDQSGGERLLQMEISRLEEENQKLLHRLQTVEAKAASALSERDELKQQLVTVPNIAPPTHQHHDVIALQERIVELQQQLSERATPPSSHDMEQELADKSKALLVARAELERVSAELDKKFSDTAQYINLRKMLASKNDQIKELRSQLQKYQS